MWDVQEQIAYVPFAVSRKKMGDLIVWGIWDGDMGSLPIGANLTSYYGKSLDNYLGMVSNNYNAESVSEHVILSSLYHKRQSV